MNNKSLSLKAVLLLSYTYTMMATTLIMPIMGNLAMQFPQAGTKISMLISLPSLIMIPAILLSGYLSKIISKKSILIFGSVLYIIGGLFGGLYDNIDYILVMRAIGGLGTGLVFPLIPALIAQLYQGQQVPQMIGWGNAAGSIFSMVFATVCGYLAVLDWHYAFYLYFIYVLLLIAQIVVLPQVPPEKQDVSMTDSEDKTRLNWLAYVYVLATLIYMIIAMVYIVKVAIFIMTENIGNSANAGMASSVTSFVALIGSLLFGEIFKILKRYTAVFGFASTGICYYLLSIAHSFDLMVAASVFMGISLSTVLPYMMTMVTKVVPKGAQTTAVSFVSTAMYIGQFLAAYYVQAVESFANGVTRTAFSMIAVQLLIIVVIAVVFILSTNNKIDKFTHESNSVGS
jgi:MFS family permease